MLLPLQEQARHNYLKKPFEVRQCVACDFVFQTFCPDDKEVAELYRLHLDETAIDREIVKQKLHWFSHVAEEVLVMRQLLPTPRPRVLDFGCNWGKWASMAQAFGCIVDAVEINPVTSKFCRSRGIRVIAPEEIEPHSYDFINVDQVMEHLTEPLRLAKQLAAGLAPRGLMKWSTPHDEKLVRRLKAAALNRDEEVLHAQKIGALLPLYHTNLFSNKSLTELAHHAGLRGVSLPFFMSLAAGQLWNMPRQIGRNLTVPWKRWRKKGTYLWFTRRD
jgi:2-polyprenyl-3-methyl-5-hydroxy-6-metoxy-1,4-benzoquinol methylase